MKKLDYEIPGLSEAEYGKFVQGSSAPGKANDNDQSSGDIL